ncbi:hypothetical protein [uncultured Paenibacillus sp.]|uniref:hypothetical protein n=1 Tax=uncultured Paenibacillus sp. TaxID=227322 RepID=UPI0028D3DECE|nr:hypothetical protein [uncultured Paenibacillus sp.]
MGLEFVEKRMIAMSTARRKPPAMKRKPKEEVNKKALIWIGASIAAVVVAMALLLIFNG